MITQRITSNEVFANLRKIYNFLENEKDSILYPSLEIEVTWLEEDTEDDLPLIDLDIVYPKIPYMSCREFFKGYYIGTDSTPRKELISVCLPSFVLFYLHTKDTKSLQESIHTLLYPPQDGKNYEFIIPQDMREKIKLFSGLREERIAEPCYCGQDHMENKTFLDEGRATSLSYIAEIDVWKSFPNSKLTIFFTVNHLIFEFKDPFSEQKEGVKDFYSFRPITYKTALIFKNREIIKNYSSDAQDSVENYKKYLRLIDVYLDQPKGT